MAINKKPIVVGLGELLWDLLPGGKKLGGAPANFAFHADSLGGIGYPVSSVGDDELGREIMTVLKGLDLDSSYVEVQKHHPTGTVTVALDAAGKATYTIHENVAWDYIPFGLGFDTLAESAAAVCVGSLAQRAEGSRRTIRKFLAATRPDCIRVFDVNLRQHFFSKEVIEDTLYACNWFKLNDEEWPVLAGMLGIKLPLPEGLREMRERYSLQLIALTCGSAGSIVSSHEGLHQMEAIPATVIDTVGAGDSFTAALVMGVLKGHPVGYAHECAARVAAYVCSKAGATPDLPVELKQLI